MNIFVQSALDIYTTEE